MTRINSLLLLAVRLVQQLVPHDLRDEVIGDLFEAHNVMLKKGKSPLAANSLTSLRLVMIAAGSIAEYIRSLSIQPHLTITLEEQSDRILEKHNKTPLQGIFFYISLFSTALATGKIFESVQNYFRASYGSMNIINTKNEEKLSYEIISEKNCYAPDKVPPIFSSNILDEEEDKSIWRNCVLAPKLLGSFRFNSFRH